MADEPADLRVPAIAGRALSKRYGGVQAVQDVSVAAYPGEVLGIMGENGAGKSTLVKMLSGLERPDSGTIEVAGEQVDLHVPSDAQRVGVRIAPQELLLSPELTVAENLLMGQLPRHARWPVVDWAAAHRIAAERLAFLGIDALDVRAPVATLSSVEQAFVQLARALDADTRVLVLDEPTAPMNASEVERVLAVLERIKQRGVAILYISHRMNEVFAICDRVVVLRDGVITRELPREQMDVDALVDAMVSGRSLDVAAAPVRAVDQRVTLFEASDVRSPRIEQLSLDLRAGEVAAVYGSLGSGREELGRALMGLAGEVGEIRVGGRAVARPNPRRLIAAGVGYVPAERRSQGLALELSIEQNLTLGMLGQLSRRGVLRRGAATAVAERWRDELRIASPSVEQAVGTLSGGSQQKVLIARWLAAGSSVLLLEEPTRGVDIATKAEIYRALRAHADAGGAVLVVSSDLEEVARIGDRVVVMRSGRTVGELTDASENSIAALAMAA